ncbi:hypothetical protein B7R54_11455 [Subtercola boreus]|uniref:Uncharacterized protein n=1 Tax=Subtercola boreus TaxID=120213 RepID=A0A3E0VJE9_9MICO|nr:DUF6264 family protein [Subtercola boreus]RFA09755.1 hypothetical protein B7R54_11455 [Subtercola boreus]TQL53137.1 hypothetical protein FB464_0630 [Subtercola boreus]
MVDDRPKPKYGELAPEGWEWKPPAPPAGADVPVPAAGGTQPGSAPSPYGGQAVPPTGQPRPYSPLNGQDSAPKYGATAAGAPRRLNTADVVATGVLLFFGILLSASMVPALFDFNTVLGQAAAMQGYGSFAASSAAQTVGTVAGVLTVILNLGSIILSVRRVQRRRIAFFIPLVFGAVTFVVWIGAITFAFFSDPSFLQEITAVTGTTAP